MTAYQKTIGTIFILLALVIFGLLIWAVSTSNNKEDIDKALDNSDTTNVVSILITPYNLDWPVNLTLDTVYCEEKTKINDLIQSLQNMTVKPEPKWAKDIWKCKLIVHYDRSFNTGLKENNKLTFHITNSEAGLFIVKTNVTGHTTYISEDLKLKLEKLTDYHTPLGEKK